MDVSLLYTNNDEGRQEAIEDEGERKAQQHRGFAFVSSENFRSATAGSPAWHCSGWCEGNIEQEIHHICQACSARRFARIV
jgi:hypothetical protein